MRIEHDFLGELEVPDNAYYGVQSLRGSHNFNITGQKLDSDFIIALAMVKKAAAMANLKTARLDSKIAKALIAAADEIIAGINNFITKEFKICPNRTLFITTNYNKDDLLKILSLFKDFEMIIPKLKPLKKYFFSYSTPFFIFLTYLVFP